MVLSNDGFVDTLGVGSLFGACLFWFVLLLRLAQEFLP
jgi:hypothetical protein